jgi:chromosome partitioning protein
MGVTDGEPRVIAILNQKGGVGKTTSTVNLGAAMASMGQRVCLLDLDPQGHLTLHLGIDEGDVDVSIYDLLIDPDAKASTAVHHPRENLDVILSDTDLAGAELELANLPAHDRNDILKRKFKEIAGNYDIVLIDCPPSLGLLTINAMAMAHEVIVPMQAHFLALQGVGKLLRTVSLVSQGINPDLKVSGVILCMHEPHTTLAKEVEGDLREFFEAAREQDVPWNRCRVLDPPIRRNIKLAEAPSFGNTIFDYDPTCHGAKAYRTLASNITTRWTGESEPRDGAEENHDDANEGAPPPPSIEVIAAPPESPKTTHPASDTAREPIDAN